ncbi:MAG: nucleotidyl transferase AbiEii/AbiGii toxin family protein [Acidimicrobiales bacterium]
MTIDNREINRRGVKAWATTPATSGASTIRIKIEVNAAEATPRMALEQRLHEVDLPRWWSGRAQVLTFQGPELVGAKFRALAQRSKGRDLWDLWLCPPRTRPTRLGVGRLRPLLPGSRVDQSRQLSSSPRCPPRHARLRWRPRPPHRHPPQALRRASRRPGTDQLDR